MVGYCNNLSARIDSISKRSLPAPHQVAVDQSLGRDRLTTLHGGPHCINECGASTVGRRSGGLPIIPPSQPHELGHVGRSRGAIPKARHLVRDIRRPHGGHGRGRGFDPQATGVGGDVPRVDPLYAPFVVLGGFP